MIPLGPPSKIMPAPAFVFAAIVVVEVQEEMQPLPVVHAAAVALLAATPVKMRSVVPLRTSMTGAPAAAAVVSVTMDVEHWSAEPPVGSPVPL